MIQIFKQSEPLPFVLVMKLKYSEETLVILTVSNPIPAASASDNRVAGQD
jgi:hypothetical protein